MRVLRTFVGCIGLAIIAASCTPAPETTDVTLYFYSQGDLQNATFDDPIAVSRSVPSPSSTMDNALRMLFAGPTDDEERLAGARTSDDLSDLRTFYLGVSQENGTAIVNFRPEALMILNSAAARQLLAKAPIEHTLLQFNGITDVQYAIDGKIFDAWDA